MCRAGKLLLTFATETPTLEEVTLEGTRIDPGLKYMITTQLIANKRQRALDRQDSSGKGSAG